MNVPPSMTALHDALDALVGALRHGSPADCRLAESRARRQWNILEDWARMDPPDALPKVQHVRRLFDTWEGAVAEGHDAPWRESRGGKALAALANSLGWTAPALPQLSEAARKVMDYLRQAAAPVMVKEIRDATDNPAKSTVDSILARWKAAGWVHHSPKTGYSLTDTGREVARRLCT